MLATDPMLRATRPRPTTQAPQRTLQGLIAEYLQSSSPTEDVHTLKRGLMGRPSELHQSPSSDINKLRQLGERAWLYVVTFCKVDLPAEASACLPARQAQAGRPRLRIIQDPISRLNPEMLYRQIQYLVAQDDWERQGEEVPA